jgi:hypothetical protein
MRPISRRSAPARPGSREGYLAPEFTGGLTFIKSGYLFSMAGTQIRARRRPATAGGMGQTGSGYAAVADTLDRRRTPRYFGTNTDGVIYENTASLAPVMPEGGAPVRAAGF